MYKKILVPLDGSKRAEAILPHVASMARPFQAMVLLLKIEEPSLLLGYDEVIDFNLYQQQRDRIREQSEGYLTAIAAGLQNEGIQTAMIVKNGSVVSAILETAEENSVDLIAMASHGWSALPRVFYGSIAAGVLQRIDRPLLVIRSRDVS
jgi:nucleotide-binding universal stress UspA family protein